MHERNHPSTPERKPSPAPHPARVPGKRRASPTAAPLAFSNQAYGRIVQAKRAVGAPGDPYEREAERFADRAMGGPPSALPGALADGAEGPPAIQRASGAQGASGSDLPQAPPSWLGSGRPLPPAERRFFGARLGASFGAVRVHTGPRAQAAADALGALAFTSGRDVAFGKGRYRPGTHDGRHLIAHELAHVVQQEGDGGLYGHVQRFEAGIHEGAERFGLTTGAAPLTQEEAGAVYFGNWMRDFNQVFVPLVVGVLGPDTTFALMSYLAEKKFGRVPTPEQFGFYIPAEHIDNPAGLVAQYDLLPGPPSVTNSVAGSAPPRPARYVTPQADVSPTAPVVPASASSSGIAAPLFSADQTGVMAFIRRTNLHVERRLELAARRGRNPEGMVHFGAALHAVEDLFAHSNWVEIAVDKVLQDQPQLVPSLTGSDRRVFTYSPTVAVGEEQRPVLTTGSFTGTDTQLSIASELATILNKPPEPPTTDAQVTAEQRLTYELLRTLSGEMQSNPAFRAAVRRGVVMSAPEAVRGVPYFDDAVDSALGLPLHDLYEWTRLPNVPRWLKDALRITDLQTAIRQAMYVHVMQPAARRVESMAQEARAADTSLLVNLRNNEALDQGRPLTAVELEQMRQTEQITGESVADQERALRAQAGARVQTLRATPEPVIAGPSHSQLAKDHPNSPLFGLAFQLAVEAVQRIRDGLMSAWDAQAGGATAPHPFPAPPPDPAERALYDERTRKADEVRTRARFIRTHGRAFPQSSAYDLARMRRESAGEVRTVALAIQFAADVPDQAATLLLTLQAMLGHVDDDRVRHVRQMIRQAAAASTQGGVVVRQTLQTSEMVADLRLAADRIEQAQTHAEREEANLYLVRARDETVRTMAQNPTPALGFEAAVLLLIDRQIQVTAVTYSGHQRDMIEGRSHVLADPSLQSLARSSITLPSLGGRPAEIRQLLETSREIISHPYEQGPGAWWRPTVEAFLRRHPRQIAEEIGARNQGYFVFREPGQMAGGHAHGPTGE